MKRIMFALLAMLLLLSQQWAMVADEVQQAPSCLFFTETATQGGFSVCDDSQARFRRAFEDWGLQNIGYPISRRYVYDGFVTQAFQKALMQWRPDGDYVALINIFDDLHNAGFDDRLFVFRQTPYQLPAGWDGDLPFSDVIKKRQALLNERTALHDTYFASDDPLMLYGLPASEVQDMGNHYAIRLQRAVLQEWTENVPWASAGEVTIANGGDIAKEMAFLPAFALTTDGTPTTVEAPTKATPTATPASSTAVARKLDPRLDALGVTIEEADVAPGKPYWRVVDIGWHNEKEAGGRHHIYVDAKDESGTNLAGQPIKFFWDGGEQVLPSSTNLPMYAAGYSYNVQILGLPSDTVRGLGLGSIEQRYHNIHVEYFVQFQRTIK